MTTCRGRCCGAINPGEEASSSVPRQAATRLTYDVPSRGGVAEWFKAAVLKTAVLKGTVGSNPTPSAIHAYERP